MTKKLKVVTDITKVKAGDLYQPPVGEPVKVGKIIHRAKDAKQNDVYEWPDGARTLVTSISQVSPKEAAAAQSSTRKLTIKQREKEKKQKDEPKVVEGETAKTPRGRLLKKGWRESPRKSQEQLKDEGWVRPTKARKKKVEEAIASGERKTKADKRKSKRGGLIGPIRESGKPEPKPKAEPKPKPEKGDRPTAHKEPKKHLYAMCPICGWWHILEYTLKVGGKRVAQEPKELDFAIGLDGSPLGTPPSSVYHSRILKGAGRGSPNASITVGDLTDVDGLPQKLVDAMLAQIDYAHAVLTEPPGQRLAAAVLYHPVTGQAPPKQTYGQLQAAKAAPAKPVAQKTAPVTPAQPSPAPVTAKGPQQPVVRKKATTEAAPVKSTQLPGAIPNYSYYSSQMARVMQGHAHALLAANTPEGGPPVKSAHSPGDVKNQRVYDLYRSMWDLLTRWAEDFVGAIQIATVLHKINTELTSTKRLNEPWVPQLKRMTELLDELVSLEHLAFKGGTSIDPDTGFHLDVKESLEFELEYIEDGLEELSQKPTLEPAEAVLLASLAQQKEAIQSRLADLKG